MAFYNTLFNFLDKKVKGYISICGNIGAGKTTVLSVIDRLKGFESFYEKPEENPFFKDFYLNKNNCALPTQLWFINESVANAKLAYDSVCMGVVERSYHENINVFVETLYKNKQILEGDYKVIRTLFNAYKTYIPMPEVIFYLDVKLDTLINRIIKRNRIGESITKSYLEQLSCKYSSWISSVDFCDVVHLNGEQTSEQLADNIVKHCNQKFSL